MDISHYNTLLQLSVGLNIACIAVYKANVFGQIIETFFTKTKVIIDKRVSEVRRKISIGKTSLETKMSDSDDSFTTIGNEMLRIYNHVDSIISDDKINQLNNDIDRDYTPKCMSGIAAFSTLYALLQLVIILFNQINKNIENLFIIYSLICCIPTIIFIITKVFYMHPLYAKTRELKMSYKELRKYYINRRKLTKNPIKKIWYSYKISHIQRLFYKWQKLIRLEDKSEEDMRKEQVYSLRKRICKFLNVKVGVILAFGCLIISIITAPYLNLPISLISMSKYAAFSIAYVPFIIYAYVLYIYEKHRKEVINEYFQGAEEVLKSNEDIYRFITEYAKNSRPTNFSSE